MVARKPLPQAYDAEGLGAPGSATGNNVPDILRPGRNTNTTGSAPSSPYSNFEAEEESVWRQPAPIMPQSTADQSYRQQPAPAPTSIPTIILQNATGSSTASAFSETNPFKRKVLATAEGSAGSAGSSASLPSPSAPPPAPPVPPTTSFAQPGMDEQHRNPWQPTPADSSRSSSGPVPVITDTTTAGPGENAWASQNASEQPSRRASPGVSNARQSNLISFPPDNDGDIAGWDEVASPAAGPEAGTASALPPRPPFTPLSGKDASGENDAVYEDRNAWDDLSGISGIDSSGGKSYGSASQPRPLPANLVTETTGEGWNLVENEPLPGEISRQSTWENFTDDEKDPDQAGGETKPKGKARSKAKGKAVDPAGPGTDAAAPLISIDSPPPTSQPGHPSQNASAASATSRQKPSSDEEAPLPHLPPRSMLDIGEGVPPRQPPRPANTKPAETYQVKNVAWHDVRAAQNPRVSPILVQNANGPCPLVALVNALTLTTPADISTALVEMLRSREQVSLSFLLDAVFDELMSSRRSNNDGDLPDVGELYKFLKGLHTGMNVNPRFIPTPEVLTAFRRTSLTHLHPTERDDMIPGTFEDTREMQLYATFRIPLIHGWLPSKDDAAYDALSRQAASYEDVQNLLFREEELEEKLSSSNGNGLTEDEQGLYQDILEIKTFLHVSATQLTPFGLDVVAKAMRPGSFAILFRNDHFSTLYRHPQTMQLLSLVTDAGYAGHDEVIWETLVDVNGEHAEFYSGDFRLVGGNSLQEPLQRQEQYADAASSGSNSGASSRDQGSWTTVRGRRQKKNDQSEEHQQPLSKEELSRNEQEDRDLALALQLQEEEEERHRADEARRNSQLSEQFIEQNARPSTHNVYDSRRPSNATGGGRYNSAQQIPVSPRRSSAGHYSNNSLLSDNNHRRTSSSSASGSALRTSLANSQRGQYNNGRTQSASPSQQQQVVRPLVPPASTTRIVSPRPAVSRQADLEESDEAPPSYEQAAKQAPYHPPPGAPGSESATARSSTAGSSSNTAAATTRTSPSPRPPATLSSTTGRPFVTPGNYPQQTYRQQQAATSRADRECTIM